MYNNSGQKESYLDANCIHIMAVIQRYEKVTSIFYY